MSTAAPTLHPNKSHQPNRLEYLDAIRGLASYLVVYLHYFHIFLLALLPILTGTALVSKDHQTLEQTIQFCAQQAGNLFQPIEWSVIQSINAIILGGVDIGKVGVLMFFLVSGFVIPFSLFRPEKPLIKFWISRLCRLYPVYWVTLTLIVLWPHREIPMTALSIAANYTMLQKFFLIPDINGVAWTLQIEISFYVLCGFLFALHRLKDDVHNLLCIAGLTLMAFGLAAVNALKGVSLPVALPLGLSLMFWGYLIRKELLGETDSKRLQRATLIRLGLLYLLSLVPICFLGYGEAGTRYLATYWSAVFFFLGFCTVWKMHHPIALFLGKISYSLYLVHAFLGTYVIRACLTSYPDFFRSTITLLPLWLFLFSLVAIAASWILYVAVEKPAIAVGKRWVKQLKPSPEPASGKTLTQATVATAQ